MHDTPTTQNVRSSQLATTRRDFLKTSAGLAVGTLAAGIVRPAEARQLCHPCRWNCPMKLSLAAYSFNRALPRNWPAPREGKAEMTLEDFIDYCASLGLEGTELTSYYFRREITDWYLDELKVRTWGHGMEISGTAIGNNFCVAEGEPLRKEIELAKKWVDYAARLGAPVIRIFAGRVPKGDTEENAMKRCVASINELVEYAEPRGVMLGLENHGGVTATPEQLLSIVKRVKKSDYFGINFDSGNFQLPDPYAALEKIAPYAVNAQIKVSMHPQGRGSAAEPADFARIIKILKDAEYRGFVVLEYEEKDDPKENIPRHIDKLRSLI